MEEFLVTLQSLITPNALIELAIIAFLVYKVLISIAGTQAEQVVKGMILLLVLVPISDVMGFTTVHFILTSMFTWIMIIFVIVFQPELRTALEQLGNRWLLKDYLSKNENPHLKENVHKIIQAITDMSQDHIGALIVFEKNTGLKNIADTGVKLDMLISTEIIENIFTPNRPLHDGAMIINLGEDVIKAAGCLLPLSDNRLLDTNLGTRHRAGLGVSEQSDALTIILSEETGYISYSQRGELFTHISPDFIEDLLIKTFSSHFEEVVNEKKLEEKDENIQ